MPRYLVERTFSEGLGIPTTDDGARSCLSVVENNADSGVTWLHSYVTEDRRKTFCVYDGPEPRGDQADGVAQRASGRLDHADPRARPLLLLLRRLGGFMRRFVLSLLALSSLCVAGVALAAGAFDGAKPATARFHDLEKARAAGYTVRVADAAGLTCIAQPGQGAMGIHMLNPALLDGAVDAELPELLVYEPKKDGELKLVALEYLVFQGDWKGSGPPALFGRHVRLHGHAEPVRPAGVLLAPRVDLEAEPEWHPDPVEPAGELLNPQRPGPGTVPGPGRRRRVY